MLAVTRGISAMSVKRTRSGQDVESVGAVKSVGNSMKSDTPSEEEQSVGPMQLFVPMFTYKTKQSENKQKPQSAESQQSTTSIELQVTETEQ